VNRPADLRVWRWAAGPASAVLALGALTLAVSVRDPLPGEDALARRLVVGNGPWQDVWAGVATATDLLPLVVVATVGALGLVTVGRWKTALAALGSCAVVWLVNPALKALVARPRPDVTALPGHLSEHSFPSGHVANSAVVVGAAVLIVASWRGTHRIVSLALGAVTLIVVATAQLALGRHYPSDIVAGWLLAAAVLATAAGLMRSTDDFR